MKYRLHNRLGSGGFVVEATLAAAQIAFEYRPINSVPNQPLGDKIKDLNLWGQVPVLELEDGTRITEVAAILAHLSYAETSVKHGPHIFVDDHPLFLRWTVFLAVNVYEGILRQSYTERYFSDSNPRPGTSPSNFVVENKHLIAESICMAASDRIHAAFKCIERESEGHKFLLSNRMSPCDVFLAMLYAWHNKKPDLPKCTWITTQIATDDIIGPIWARNFHDRLDFKWHKL